MGKKTTLKDIARRAGLNATTVSRALQDSPLVAEETRRRVQALADELNYIPNLNAKYLRGSKTNIVGLIVDDNTNPYYAHIIQAVQSYLREKGFFTLIFNNYENVNDEIEIIKTMCSFNVAGVLLTPARGNRRSAELLRANGVPYVLISRYVREGEDNYVVVDDEMAGYLAAKHMLSRHCRKTFFLNQFQGITTVDRRTDGYLRALREFGITPEPDWVVYNCATRECGYETMHKLVKTQEAPFSVLCYNDYVAEGVLTAIYDGNYRIPEEISVIGIDNVEPFSIGQLKLSTVDVHMQEIARISVERLLVLIDNENERDSLKSEQIIISPELIVGDTT